jgi:hypothetical protein
MNQRQLIVAAAAVGLVSAALWVWRDSANNSDTTQAPLPAQKAAAPAQLSPPSAPVAASASSAPAPTTQPQQAEPAPAAPDVSQTAVSAPVEPANVDTPEPAERKFAQGGKPQPDQN